MSAERDTVAAKCGPARKMIHRTRGTPSKEAQALADDFLSDLEAGRIADPSCALALLVQGVKDGASERLCASSGARCLGPCPCAEHARTASAGRIEQLEGHRKQWRGIAFQLLDVLNEVDSWADYPESTQERLREVRAIFEERSDADLP